MRRFVLLLAIVCAVVAFAACGDDKKKSEPAAEPGTTITIENLTFSTVSVRAGSTVTVDNKDTTTHTVTSDTKGQFDTGEIDGGTTASFTAPSQPGTYPYHCEIHKTTMKATLTVVP